MLQFELSRDIDGAARDVQAAINAARADCPSLPSNPTYRKVNPADAPIMILSLTSDTLTRRQIYDAASIDPRAEASQIDGVGQVDRRRRPRRPCGSRSTRRRFPATASAGGRAHRAGRGQRQPAQGHVEDGERHWQLYANDQARPPPITAADRDRFAERRAGAPARRRRSRGLGRKTPRHVGLSNGQPAVLVIVNRQPGANIIETVDRVNALLPQLRASICRRHRPARRARSHHDDPRLAARGRAHAGHRGRAGDPRRVPVPAQRCARR